MSSPEVLTMNEFYIKYLWGLPRNKVIQFGEHFINLDPVL